MSTSVTLPQLGESVTEGTVTRWLKQVGDTVAVDEPLLEISTDKVDTEIPSPAGGTLLSISVQEDETVEVGTELAVIGSADEATAAGGPEPEPQAAATPAPAAQPPAPESAPVSAEPEPPAAESAPESAEPEPPAAEPVGAGGAPGGGVPVTLPALGESITEGTVTRWLKQVGDTVAVDEPLLEISTDKVDTELPSPVAGTLLSISVREDETVEVGTELARIGSPEQAGAEPAPSAAPPATPAAPAPPAPSPAPAEAAAPAAPTPTPEPPTAAAPAPSAPRQAAPAPRPAPQPTPAPARAEPAAPPPPAEPAEFPIGAAPTGAGAYATPLVRKLAARYDVDLDAVSGSGVGGRIRKQDIVDAARARDAAREVPAPAAAAAPAPTPGPAQPVAASPLRGTTEPLSRIRRYIAAQAVESLHATAQLTSVVEVDVTRVARLRERAAAALERREGVKLSFLPFFAKAVVDALKQHPKLNASLDLAAGTVTYHDGEHVGIAVDTDRGLLAPVVRDAGDLSVEGLARRIADLAARTRAGRLTPAELTGGTFTLFNTGSRGILLDTPILTPPQVAALSTGTVVKRPVVVDDPDLGETIAVRHLVLLALTFDQRLVDGADAAAFLAACKQRLEGARFGGELDAGSPEQ